MDNKLYTDSIEYEKLTQAIYQSILRKEGLDEICVKHNEDITGRSGVAHQIDVYWKFKQASIEHTILIECKDYSTALTLEKVRNFHSVVNDIGNCRGIIVTKIGFQSGVKKYAEYYGIELKIVRTPIEEDWRDKAKDFKIDLIVKTLVCTPEKPIKLSLLLDPETAEQKQDIIKLKDQRKLIVPSGPDMCFVNEARIPITKQMRWWIPKQVEVVDKEPGGPYKQEIQLENTYVILNLDEESEQIVKIKGINVTFWVEESDRHEIVIHGEDVVNAILKDFKSGNIEHVLRNDQD